MISVMYMNALNSKLNLIMRLKRQNGSLILSIEIKITLVSWLQGLIYHLMLWNFWDVIKKVY